MAFDPQPATWLGAGYTLSGNKVQMTTVTAGSNIVLDKLTDAQADPTTGDIRDVVRACCYAFYEAWAAQSPGNRPAKMRLVKSVESLPDLTTLRETYTMSFEVESDPQGVVDEP